MLDQGNELGCRVDVGDFRATLTFAAQPIERRNTIPILSMVRIVFDGKALTVTGSDLDIETTATCEAIGAGKFSACVEPRKLLAFCHGASGAVQIKNDGEDVVSFVVEGCTLRLRSLPVEDFPDMNKVDEPEDLIIGQTEWADATARVASCMSIECRRYYLNGLFLTKHPDSGCARVVATDGHRMGIYDLDAPGPEASGIIPRKTVGLLARAIKAGGNEPVRIEWSRPRAVFHTPAGTIRTKIIDGRYPNYASIIPEPSDNLRATVNLAAINRAISVSGERSRALTFDPELQAITCMSPDFGSTTVPCTVHGGQPWAFNGKYAQDLCRAAGGPIQLKGKDVGGPFRVTSDDPRALWVLMPMRVEHA